MSRCCFVLSLGALLLGCGGARLSDPQSGELAPGAVVPIALAEGHGDNFAELPPPKAASSSAAPAPANGSTTAAVAPSNRLDLKYAAPDPEPLRLREQWEYRVHWNAGTLEVGSVTAKTSPSPIVTARRFGRFAIELWVGHELIDRVRFDFPLLSADEAVEAKRHAPTLSAKANVWQTVLVPASPRARRALLLDRATGTYIDLPWPPTPPNQAP